MNKKMPIWAVVVVVAAALGGAGYFYYQTWQKSDLPAGAITPDQAPKFGGGVKEGPSAGM